MISEVKPNPGNEAAAKCEICGALLVCLSCGNHQTYRIAAFKQERDHLQSKLALLTDPAAVHANILRGTLPLTKAQAIHIAGLPADVEQEMDHLRAEVERLSAVLQAIDCASCGGNNLKHKRGCEQAIIARRKP